MIKFSFIKNEIILETKRYFKKINKLNKEIIIIYKKGREGRVLLKILYLI